MTKPIQLTTRPHNRPKYEGYTPWVERWQEAIANRTPFVAGNLTGEEHDPHPSGAPYKSKGWLNAYSLEVFNDDVPFIDFVVYSYGTPFAWHTEAGWKVLTSQKFSPTSGKHRSIIERAIGRDNNGKPNYTEV